MKITFTKDTGPILQSGWEFYQAGAKATLPGGDWLVANGYAFAGWGEPPEEPGRWSWLDTLMATLRYKAGPVEHDENDA